MLTMLIITSGELFLSNIRHLLLLFTKSVKWGVTNKSYQAADLFAVHDEKLFSAMCTWSNHYLHHLLPSERDTGHDLRHRGHSYQLVCYNFNSTIGVALLFVCCMMHCKHLR